jgi:hypothetical protein
MMLFAAAVLAIGVLLFTLAVRPKDLPEPEPVSPVKYLEERKATIYENLRDLQFEYRVGKLSDPDYARTKQDLQRELAAVLAEIDKVQSRTAPATLVPPAPRAATPVPGRERQAGVAQPAVPAPASSPSPSRDRQGVVCPHCGAHFPNPMKFCGECGKPIPVEATK